MHGSKCQGAVQRTSYMILIVHDSNQLLLINSKYMNYFRHCHHATTTKIKCNIQSAFYCILATHQNMFMSNSNDMMNSIVPMNYANIWHLISSGLFVECINLNWIEQNRIPIFLMEDKWRGVRREMGFGEIGEARKVR